MKANHLPVCSFGTPTSTVPHRCAGCEAETARLSAQFAAKVKAGVYDQWGYTAAEARRRPVKQLDLLTRVA